MNLTTQKDAIDEIFFEYPFIQLSAEEFVTLIRSDLTKNGISIYLRLKFREAFGDSFKSLPTLEELTEFSGASESTVRREIKKIVAMGLIAVDTAKKYMCGFKVLKNKTDKLRRRFFGVVQNCQKNVKNDIQDSKLISQRQNCHFQEPEPLPDKDFKTSQTLQTLHTPQTGKEVEKKFQEAEVINEELEISAKEADDDESTSLCGAEIIETNNNIVKEESKVTPAVVQNKYKISQELLERLRMSGVKTSEQVLVKISQHHISQAYGAITHVENTFETIKDPTAIFLYQLPRQKPEKMGQLYPDEFLEKQKRELEAIDKERAGGFTKMKDMPIVQALKEKLLKKTGLPAPE